MVWRYKNRWFRRWLVVIVFWLVPVMIVVANETRDQLAYDRDDLAHSLATWTMTDAQRAQPASAHCQGSPDDARAAGCPQDVLNANAAKHQEAIDEYSARRSVLFGYLWSGFVGYWVVPAVILFCIGAVIGILRRMLRRPARNSANPQGANGQASDAHKPTGTVKS
jgi:hypothetical protein